MQFLTVSPNPQPKPNQSYFQKKIGYYNDQGTIKPSSSMLLHHHFISVRSEQEFTGLLTALGVLGFCQSFTNKKGQTVEYHLEKNTINSRAFTKDYLISMNFPNNINDFNISSVGINVEQKLFSGKLKKNKLITGPFKGQYVLNRHIQIVYSDDSKKFDCLDGNGNQILDQNSAPRTTHNELIFNLHLKYKPNANKSLQTQLEDIATPQQVQNISQDVSFEKLFATEITNFSNSAVQEFYNYCYNPTQNFTILELDKTIQTKKLNNYQAKQKKETEINNILNMHISQDTLEIIPQPDAAPVAPTDDNPGIPHATNLDDNPIPNNIVNNSSEDSDPNSLIPILDNILKINDDTDANTEAVHSGESAEDTPEISS